MIRPLSFGRPLVCGGLFATKTSQHVTSRHRPRRLRADQVVGEFFAANHVNAGTVSAWFSVPAITRVAQPVFRYLACVPVFFGTEFAHHRISAEPEGVVPPGNVLTSRSQAEFRPTPADFPGKDVEPSPSQPVDRRYRPLGRERVRATTHEPPRLDTDPTQCSARGLE
jgi:hypothetical protein